jgi:hypothetical protein
MTRLPRKPCWQVDGHGHCLSLPESVPWGIDRQVNQTRPNRSARHQTEKAGTALRANVLATNPQGVPHGKLTPAELPQVPSERQGQGQVALSSGHGGHALGNMAGSHSITLIATVALWAIGKVVDANKHDWTCERCDHGFSKN